MTSDAHNNNTYIIIFDFFVDHWRYLLRKMSNIAYDVTTYQLEVKIDYEV